MTFLHNDAKIMHGNISPESIVIAKNGAWKLAGFDFSKNNIGSELQVYSCVAVCSAFWFFF